MIYRYKGLNTLCLSIDGKITHINHLAEIELSEEDVKHVDLSKFEKVEVKKETKKYKSKESDI
jgi:hypothetical protein